MKDGPETDNPYQPPAISDEPIAKTGAVSPNTKPHPIHWWLPLLGYAYVPFTIGLATLAFIVRGPDLNNYLMLVNSVGALFYLLPVYGLAILSLTAQRIQQRTNRQGLTLFQLLSTVPAILWLLYWITTPPPI